MKIYRAVLKDPRTPFLPKLLLGAAIAYAVSPIDLIPDFIPVLGHLDDVVIVPLLIVLALKVIPPDILLEHRGRMARLEPRRKAKSGSFSKKRR